MCDAVSNATKSIWITAYYVSGAMTGPIQEFYSTIRQKALEGKEVIMVCEYSKATRPAVRHATFNFVQDLVKDGVIVRFVQERKTMHKKMIIVDGKTVLLGSSNLTLAGTQSSDEMNVRIEAEAFARQAVEDFQSLLARAKPMEELN